MKMEEVLFVNRLKMTKSPIAQFKFKGTTEDFKLLADKKCDFVEFSSKRFKNVRGRYEEDFSEMFIEYRQ